MDCRLLVAFPHRIHSAKPFYFYQRICVCMSVSACWRVFVGTKCWNGGGTNRGPNVSVLDKVNKRFIFGPFTNRRPGFLGGGASGFVELARSVLATHFTIQCLWIQTNMEPGSSVNAVRSSRVLLGQELRPAVLIIKDGKIEQIQPHSADIACEVTNKANHTHRSSGSDQNIPIYHCCCNAC